MSEKGKDQERKSVFNNDDKSFRDNDFDVDFDD